MASPLFWGGVFATKAFNVSHSQLSVCSHRYHSKRIFLALSSQREPGSWTSTWFLAAEWQKGHQRQHRLMNTTMALGGSIDHGHPRVPVVTRTTNTNMVLGSGPTLPEAMLIFVVSVTTRAHVGVCALYSHWRPCSCSWCALPPETMLMFVVSATA